MAEEYEFKKTSVSFCCTLRSSVGAFGLRPSYAFQYQRRRCWSRLSGAFPVSDANRRGRRVQAHRQPHGALTTPLSLVYGLMANRSDAGQPQGFFDNVALTISLFTDNHLFSTIWGYELVNWCPSGEPENYMMGGLWSIQHFFLFLSLSFSRLFFFLFLDAPSHLY